MSKLSNWIDKRTGYRTVLHALLLLNFPVNRGARWRYVWGGSLALMLVVEMITGTLLMTVYSPSEAAAWGSVQYLETQVSWGWFVRAVHHYTSHMLLVVILLHTLMVVCTAGYRKPKEFTFWSGLLLGCVTLGLAISGNPLPWDQKGYWAYQIETGIMGTMPVVGSYLRTMLVGGSEFGNLTLTRLYTLHVVVLPVLAVVLLVIHVALMRREKLLNIANIDLPIVNPDAKPAESGCDDMEPYWPYQTTRNLMMFLLLMVVVVTQATMYPKMREKLYKPSTAQWEQDLPLSEVKLEAPADRELPYVARPEWYVRFLFELRHMVHKDREVLITGVLPGVILLLLFLMPFYEKLLGQKLGYALAVGLTVCGMSGMLYLTYSGIHEDRTDATFQQSRRLEIDYAGRAAWLADQNGIPPEGPVTLLHNDAKAMGPILFKTHCAKCHRYNGHDGTGQPVMGNVDGKKVEAVPSASDLYQFGTTEWIAAFLANPSGNRFFGHMDSVNGGEDIKAGEMASWAEENAGDDGPLKSKHLVAVAELLAREAARTDISPASDEDLKLGVAVFSGIDLIDDDGEPIEFEGNCLQCHALKAGNPKKEEAGSDAPNLNGYASRQWLIDFIRQPGDERFYGDKNIMPGFDRTQLSDRDVGLLADWMRNQWQRAKQ